MLTLAWAAPVAAGPWTRAPGDHYAKVSQSLFRAEGFRGADGEFVEGFSVYTSHTTALYGELGVIDSLQVQAYLPYSFTENAFDTRLPLEGFLPCRAGGDSTATRLSTPGDSRWALQWDPRLLPLPHALRAEVKLPLYDLGDPRTICTSLMPQPGDGQLDATLWASIGRSFLGGRLFAFVELGHMWRSDYYPFSEWTLDYASTFAWMAQLGYRVLGDGYLMLTARAEMPYGDDGRSKGWLTVAPQVFLPLGWGFAFEAELGMTPWARYTSVGRSEQLYFTQAAVGISHTH